MANISRIDSATEADWGFVAEDGGLHKACIAAAYIATRRYDGAEWDDAYQQACLFLAVRPELQERVKADGSRGAYRRLGSNIYSQGLRPKAQRDSLGGVTGLNSKNLDVLNLPRLESFEALREAELNYNDDADTEPDVSPIRGLRDDVESYDFPVVVTRLGGAA